MGFLPEGLKGQGWLLLRAGLGRSVGSGVGSPRLWEFVFACCHTGDDAGVNNFD